ncbi:MAG: hypothetical protein IJC71_05735 [Clostridia bacterium]|nr:hypothetical protein [Clostridia bacterium]
MKKHLSVLMLYIRSSFLPLCLIFLLTAALSVCLFAKDLLPEIRFSSPGSRHGVEILGLETLFAHTAIPWIFTGALVLMTVLLLIPGTAFGSQTAYTMSRLRISDKAAFLWQAGYNTLAYFMLWAVGASVLAAMCFWYGASVSTATEHSVFLALYRDEFLHSMLPLHDTGRIVRNLSFCMALGVTTAHYTFRQRGGKASYVIIPVLIYIIRAFPEEMGALPIDIIGSVICLFLAGLLIVMVLTDRMRFLFEEEDQPWNE